MPVTSATSSRTAPLLATRTNPECRTPFPGQAKRLGADWKIPEFRLARDDQRTLGFHRPAEAHLECAGRVARHDLPSDDIRPFDADDFTGPVQPAADAAQLALQNPEGELRGLAQQARGDADVRQLEAREEQGAFGCNPSPLPSERRGAVGRQESPPALSRCGGYDGGIRLKRDVRAQAVELYGNHGAGGHGKIERVPVAALPHDRRERKVQGQQALAIAYQVVSVSIAFDRNDLGMPPIADRLVAQGRAPRQQSQPRPGLLRPQLAAQSEIHAARGLVDLACQLGAEQFSLGQHGAPFG